MKLGLLLLALGTLQLSCKNTEEVDKAISEACKCKEPMNDDPTWGDDGDSHLAFDLDLKEDISIHGRESGVEFYEFEDLHCSYSVEYIWAKCPTSTPSTPGTSGNLKVVWTFKDLTTGSLIKEATFFMDLRMGERQLMELPVWEGFEVLGNDPLAKRSIEYSIELFPTTQQECPFNGENNKASKQFIVNNCPCPLGDAATELYPLDVTYNTLTQEVSWTNVYDWTPCGREADEIVEETGTFREVITAQAVDGSWTDTFNYTGTTFALNTTQEREAQLLALGNRAAPYNLTVTLSEIGDGVDCEASQSKSFTLLVD